MAITFPTALDTDATLHQLVNNLASTLTAAYTSPATTLDLADASAFPATGSVIYVGGERGTYTGKTANQLTGVAGLTNNYSSGTTVEQLFEAAHHNDIRDAVKALEAKVGIDSSDVASSHDYKIAQKPGLTGSNPAALGSVSPGVASDAARSDHVHPTTGLELTANKATGFGTVNDTLYPSVQAVKNYVDGVQQGLDIKASVRVASTANIAVASALVNASTIDGVVVATGDRVLLKNQTTGAENGIYVVAASGAASRASDADVSVDVTTGMYVFVSEGTANADTGFVLTTNDPITLGTTALVFTQFSGAGQIIAGNGLSKSGNTLTINTAVTADLSTAQTLTNKTFTDPKITGGSFKYTLTGGSLAADRILNIPVIPATDTLATLGLAQSWTAQQTFKEVKDTVHTITDGAAFEIDPANGSMQVVTLGASRTPAATNFEAGQIVLLGIDDGAAYAVTWTTVAVTWVKPGGSAAAPTLATSGYTWVLLWKVGSTIYGAEVGKP
jgi:hypothetical protein